MANWNDICVTAKAVANKAMQKTGEMADLAAMKIRLKALESKRDEQYKRLGKLTYRQLKTGESQADKIAPTVERLDVVREKIRLQVAEIEEERAARAAKRAEFFGFAASETCEEEDADCAAEGDAE